MLALAQLLNGGGRERVTLEVDEQAAARIHAQRVAERARAHVADGVDKRGEAAPSVGVPPASAVSAASAEGETAKGGLLGRFKGKLPTVSTASAVSKVRSAMVLLTPLAYGCCC